MTGRRQVGYRLDGCSPDGALDNEKELVNAKGPHRRTGADLNCAPKGIRTPDLLFRRQTLYPAELWAHLVSLEKNRSP